METRKYPMVVTRLSELPKSDKPYYVIMTQGSHTEYYDRDDHGSTSYHILISAYIDEKEWTTKIQELTKQAKDFSAAMVTPAKIEVAVSIKI